MTLVPNLRQRSNGNSIWLFFILVALLFSSCSLLKKADDGRTSQKNQGELDEIQGKRKYNPATGKYEYDTEVTEKMDTIVWQNGRPGDAPPITSPTGAGSTDDEGLVGKYDPRSGNYFNVESPKLPNYNVTLLLPFLTNQFSETSNQLPRNSSWALNFYGGAKMALKRLDQEGIKLRVKVVDTQASETQTNRLLETTELLNADLIIGPYRQRNVQLVASFAKQYKKPMVSPHSASLSVAEENPYYIQVNPSLRTHCEAITREVRRQFTADQVVLLCRNNPIEQSALKYFQEANYAYEGTISTPRFQELVLNNFSPDSINTLNFGPYLKDNKTTVFIIPSWQDESFVFNVLRRINVSKQFRNVVVFGMPQWINFDRITPDYFERLNVHISTANFVDRHSEAVKFFKQEYYNTYGTLPGEEAYLGFDTVLFFGRMIHKYGSKFQYYIDRENEKYLHTSFKFEPVIVPVATAEDFSRVDRFENKFVNILKFENYQFVGVSR